jgi:RNA polymerase sigma-70 factor (ECF subfamily)
VDAGDAFLLVEAARAGDHDAWETLYRRVYPRLRAYVVGRVGASRVDDVMNETLTRAIASIDRFRWEPAGFDAWLFGIARHVCGDEHRRVRRAALLAAKAPAVVGEPLPGEALERVEDQERVRRLFARLSANERELLELRLMVGLSAEDAARVLGRSPGAVRTAQSRALSHLRRLWDSDL